MAKKLLAGFRLAVLAGIVFLNWLLIALCLALFGMPDATASFVAAIIEAALFALAFTPAGETYFRLVNRLRPAFPGEEEVLRPALQRVVARCGLTWMPELFVQQNAHLNAVAVGTRTIAVTEGLLYGVTLEELEAVLAHEVAHLLNGDTRVRLMASVVNLAGSISLWAVTAFMAFMSFIGFTFGEWNRELSGIGWLFLIFAWTIKAAVWLLTKVLELSYLAVNRHEEFAADEYAARKGYRDALISFLNRVPDGAPGGLAALYATHPSPEARIARLVQFGG
ncbi:MAG: M48 family metallopeptidase [Desulfotomaculales bacterium]